MAMDMEEREWLNSPCESRASKPIGNQNRCDRCAQCSTGPPRDEFETLQQYQARLENELHSLKKLSARCGAKNDQNQGRIVRVYDVSISKHSGSGFDRQCPEPVPSM